MWVNGAPVRPEYDPVSGTIHWQPFQPLAPGMCKVKIYAKDNAGNPSVPPAEWSFQIEGEGVDE